MPNWGFTDLVEKIKTKLPSIDIITQSNVFQIAWFPWVLEALEQFTPHFFVLLIFPVKEIKLSDCDPFPRKLAYSRIARYGTLAEFSDKC